MPISGSVIAIFGRPYAMSGAGGTGMLIITVEDIVYNPGTAHIVADSSSPTSVPSRRLQVRKRRKLMDDTNSTWFISFLCFVS